MMEKYITSAGKKYLLQLGFLNDDNTNNFNFVALGVGENSKASSNNGVGFEEADGYHYQREQFKIEESYQEESSIALSATFDSTNFNPSNGVQISEIGIVNQDVANNNDEWFAYMKVPPITKTSNVSLKYTVIISLE